MDVYKRGKYYWVDLRDAEGRRVRRSTKCSDRKAAIIASARIERELADPRRAAANAATVGSALSDLIRDRQTSGRADGTVDMYRTKAGHVARIFGGEAPLSSVDAAAVDRYIAQRLDEGAMRTTIGKELTTIRAALKIAKRRGRFAPDLAEVMPIGWRVDYVPRKRALQNGQDLQDLIDALPPHRGAHVAFLVATAARDSEAERAELEDIDLARGVVYIRGTKTEGAAAWIAIVAWMHPLLEAVVGDRAARTKGPIFEPWGNIQRDLRAAAMAVATMRYARAMEITPRRVTLGIGKGAIDRETVSALFPPLSPNDLRRTHATWLRAAGIDLGLLARQLRHADTKMVSKVYATLDASTAGRVMAAHLGEDCDKYVPDPGAFSGHSGRSGLATKPKTPRKEAFAVPRDGIEPPTRGFSILLRRSRNTINKGQFGRGSRGCDKYVPPKRQRGGAA